MFIRFLQAFLKLKMIVQPIFGANKSHFLKRHRQDINSRPDWLIVVSLTNW